MRSHLGYRSRFLILELKFETIYAVCSIVLNTGRHDLGIFNLKCNRSLSSQQMVACVKKSNNDWKCPV